MHMTGIVFSTLFTVLPAMLFRIACYVLTSVGLYTMAKSRGISKPWLAWIPVIRLWLIGSLSDQYRYVTQGRVKNKRMLLLILGVCSTVMAAMVSGMVSGTFRVLFMGFMNSISVPALSEEMARRGMMLSFWILPLIAAGFSKKVIEYMALFDIYESCDPENSVVYLVFSILIGATRPFFLFLNRNKEEGMPPRLDHQESSCGTWSDEL